MNESITKIFPPEPDALREEYLEASGFTEAGLKLTQDHQKPLEAMDERLGDNRRSWIRELLAAAEHAKQLRQRRAA